MTIPSSNNTPKHLKPADLRGFVKLSTRATTGVTQIVEGVHRSVWDILGISGSSMPGRTSGITGLVYRSIHGVTQAVGTGLDLTLSGMEALVPFSDRNQPVTSQRAAMLAALNGVLGDHLVADNNPLAMPMTLRWQGEALDLGAPKLKPTVTGKVMLLIHGLCMNDLQWSAQDDENRTDYGQALAATLGYTPVYLRYNSGLHISQNGRELAAQLEQLAARWPVPIDEVTVIAHSMGGLLIRSAVHYARQHQLSWPDHLRNIVFLGTPHHGAPLERIGAWVDELLAATPYTAPFAALGRMRSAGITDLRYGHLLDEDWWGRDRFQRHPDRRQILSLPEGVNCYTVAATTCAKRNIMANRFVGDGLVPLDSALGHHDDPQRILAFEEGDQTVMHSMHHITLLRSPAVTQQLIQWLQPYPGSV